LGKKAKEMTAAVVVVSVGGIELIYTSEEIRRGWDCVYMMPNLWGLELGSKSWTQMASRVGVHGFSFFGF